MFHHTVSRRLRAFVERHRDCRLSCRVLVSSTFFASHATRPHPCCGWRRYAARPVRSAAVAVVGERARQKHVRLLTVEKTVIRFRGNTRPLSKRVSRAPTTTRCTTRTSARNITRWMRAASPPQIPDIESGIPSRATRVPSHHRDAVANATTFRPNPFRCAARVDGCTRVRLPRAVLSTGQLYMQVH